MTSLLPFKLEGRVVHGFGRGSKQLGIPTANFDETATEKIPEILAGGIYYGWAKLEGGDSIYPMVMSLGWNPFFKNEKKSAEVHIIHSFDEDFYDRQMAIVIVDYIRPEKSYDNLDDLISDIQSDIQIAKDQLKDPKNITLQKMLS